jgi:phospholipid-binding lipoprotein MlaA
MNNKNIFKRCSLPLCSLIFLGLLSGCASTGITDPRDPWEGWNRGTMEFNDTLDEYAMKPVAKGYRWITPDFVDQGVSNFFGNLKDIGVAINDLLQLKFVQGGMDTGRFLVNSTVGIAGLFDVATMIDLPKHDEDFGQTLGFWGVPSGPYLVLPLLGPSSPRGTVGIVGDALMNPMTYTFLVGGAASTAASVAGTAAGVVNVVDQRADILEAEQVASEAAVDRYAFFRDAYMQHRRYQVLDGNVPEEEYDVDFELDDEFDELEKEQSLPQAVPEQ